MSPNRGSVPLSYRRLCHSELGFLAGIEFDPGQLERFLGPIAAIVAAIRRGPAHSLVGIEAAGEPVGFFVLHPEPRDGACWWLGWLALDRRQQGRGYGSAAMRAITRRLRQVPGCRRVRLLVAPDNAGARTLYERFGFHEVGQTADTGELIMEAQIPSPSGTDNTLKDFILYVVASRARRVFRHRRLRLTAGPHPAWVIGVERGPPVARSAARTGHDNVRSAARLPVKRDGETQWLSRPPGPTAYMASCARPTSPRWATSPMPAMRA